MHQGDLVLSKCSNATVADLSDTNKLLEKSKCRQHQTMIVHALEPNDIVMATWLDAGRANQPDLSSTKGIFIECTSKRILQGSLEAVNPIFWSVSKISRVCRSSASAETRAAVDGENQMYA